MKNKITWNCLGDSLTADAYVDRRYYDYIAARSENFRVRQYGICGTKIAGTVSDAFCHRYSEMEQADIITVFGGVNDWGQKGNGGPTPLGMEKDKTDTTFYGALNLLCSGLREKFPEALLLFMTPFGNGGYPGAYMDKNSFGLTVEDYVDAIIRVCEKYDIPVIDLYRESGISPYDKIQNEIYFLDGMHLNEQGHEKISYVIENAVFRYYDRKQGGEAREDKTIDFFMFMGQSNMAGRGTTDSVWIEPAALLQKGAGYEFRAVSDPGRLYEIEEPFGVNENTVNGIDDKNKKTGSMVTAFVNAYNKYAGVSVVGVSASEGGTSIEQWQPESRRLSDAICRCRAAVRYLESEGYCIRHRFMLWCQGETDGDHGMKASVYQEKFMNMLKAMKAEGIEKCFLVRIGRYNGKMESIDYSEILDAQTDLAESNADVVMVSGDMVALKARNRMKDSYHYYQKAYNEIGYQAGVMAAYYVHSSKKPKMYDLKEKIVDFEK